MQKKKPSHLRKNSSSLNIRLVESIYLEHKKEERVQLPKIKEQDQKDAQRKSVKDLMDQLETYLEAYQGQAKELLQQCLQVLKKSHFLIKPLSKQSLQKPVLSSMSSNIDWGKDSQVLNFRRAKLKKVQSKQLFQKMRMVKYQQDPGLSKLSEKEVITLLRGKINDKENTIARLHQSLEQMRMANEEQGFSLKVYQSSQAEITIKNELLEKEKIKLQRQIEELHQKIASQEKNRVSIEKYWEKSAKSEMLQRKLKEREDELIALWQTSLAGRTSFPI